jgi:integrase
MVGIERIGWLTDMEEPIESPKLGEILKLYIAKPGLTVNEIGRSKLFWGEFTRAVGVQTAREIKHDQIAAYEKSVQGRGLSPKSILHRYRKIRTMLAYAIKRGKGASDCRKALDVTEMLEVKNHTPLDPRPIAPKQFWAIYDAAVAAKDHTFAAMLLVVLNMAGYAGEVAALKWEEINLKTGEVATRRLKTGVPRVCVLWPETLKALKKLPQQGEYLFYTKVRSYTVFSALDSWRKYRDAAKLPDALVFGQVRDAAFTIACRTSLDAARVLAGHRLPGAVDHYVLRQPQFVKDVCDAIRKEFFTSRRK